MARERRGPLAANILQDVLRRDLLAHGYERWRWRYRFSRPQLQYQRLLRRVEYSRQTRSPLSAFLYAYRRFKLARLSQRLGLSVPPNVFGPGLSIAHYGSVVVNDQARVGRYCRLHSATNIGRDRTGAPTIGDFVYIGPGAVIYGGITVGDRAVIGANSVVNANVGAGVTVAGAPAKQISTRGSESVMPPYLVSLMGIERA